MQVPWVRGRVATQAHVGLPEGTVEEEYARDGFSGAYAHLYRKNPPVGWTRIEGPLKPRAYDTRKLEPKARTNLLEVAMPAVAGDWLASRTLLLENDDVRLDMGVLAEPMPWFFRNADADELVFVHDGAGRLETDFGPLAYEPGDYLLVPRGTVYRFAPSAARPTRVLVVASRPALGLPDRGLLGQHALFDPAVIRVPTPGDGTTAAPNAEGEHELRVLSGGEVTRIFYPFSPIETVGWKGTLAPMQINVRDIRPVASERYHLPPTAHATFVANGVVVCTFLPRPLETGDRTALKVPFFHANVDYDEVLFYHAGEFFSRAGIAAGMMTHHPRGIHHGPQPGAAERAADATRTEEVAVMIDTRAPLRAASGAAALEMQDYWKSWKGGAR